MIAALGSTRTPIDLLAVRVVVATWLIAATAACGPALMKLPAGLAAPAADAAGALADATAACRTVTSITSEIAVSGSIGGQRVRGRLVAGLAAPASARLEAVAPFGQPLFIFVARDNDATLLLPRDNRVLEHGRSGAVLEAIAGVPLDSSDLRMALTGCAATLQADRGQRFGDDWRVVPDGATDVYLHRDATAAPWRIVATLHHRSADEGGFEWRAEYRDFERGLPKTIRFRTSDGERFDLRLALSQVDINVTLGADAFRVEVPRDADPITLEELKEAGPFRTRKADGSQER